MRLTDTIDGRLAPPSGGQEAGQGLAEYALILGLIAIVAIASMVFLGNVIASLMSSIGSTIEDQT